MHGRRRDSEIPSDVALRRPLSVEPAVEMDVGKILPLFLRELRHFSRCLLASEL